MIGCPGRTRVRVVFDRPLRGSRACRAVPGLCTRDAGSRSNFAAFKTMGLSAFAKARGVGFVPVPGGLDDRSQVGVLRRPAEFAADLRPRPRPVPAGRRPAAGLPSPAPSCRSPPRPSRSPRGRCSRGRCRGCTPARRPARASPARGGAPRPGHRRGCSRGRRCRRASGSRCRRSRRAAACPSAAWMTSGIRCVSGSWSSPMVPSGGGPGGVEVAQGAVARAGRRAA